MLLAAMLAVCLPAVIGRMVPGALAQAPSLYLRMILVKDEAAARKVSDLLAQGRPVRVDCEEENGLAVHGALAAG